MKFEIKKGTKDFIENILMKGVVYESKMLDYIQTNFKEGTFVDVGSYIGTHSLFFSEIADKVISFEPIRETYLKQLRNIELNGVTNIEVHNCAIGSKTGTIDMRIGTEYNRGNSHVVKGDEQSTHTVKVFKLDDFNLKGVTVIKIDVEEHELEVLKGAEETIRNNKPGLFIEIRSTMTELTKFNSANISHVLDNKEFKQIYDFLKQFNYEVSPYIFGETPTYHFRYKYSHPRDEKSFSSKDKNPAIVLS